MLMYPEAQRKAQEEVDRLVVNKHGQLPTFEDRERLGYLKAVLKEVLRWNTPLGLRELFVIEAHDSS